MAEPADATAVGSFGTRLSLAVDLVDAVTGGDPVGSPAVALADAEVEPVRTRSGYHAFLDLPAGDVTLQVDGGERYADVERTGVATLGPGESVDASDPAALPVETVALQPTPAYAFPAAATVVRGTVRDADGDPVPGASVSVEGVGRTTTSTAAGEYVYYFARPLGTDVAVTDGAVTVAGSKPTLVATDGDLGTTTATVRLPEAATTTLDLAF